jgi:hypothetical protein
MGLLAGNHNTAAAACPGVSPSGPTGGTHPPTSTLILNALGPVSMGPRCLSLYRYLPVADHTAPAFCWVASTGREAAVWRSVIGILTLNTSPEVRSHAWQRSAVGDARPILHMANSRHMPPD